MPLSWVEADRSHIADLQSFVCTYPARAIYNGTRIRFHPAIWELDVQSYLRGQELPKQPPDYLILGYNETGQLEAVVLYARDDEDEYWIIDAIARSISARNTGIGEEALQEALRRIDAEGRHGVVTAHISRSNLKSKSLFSANGFTFAYFQDPEGTEEVWALDRSPQR